MVPKAIVWNNLDQDTLMHHCLAIMSPNVGSIEKNMALHISRKWNFDPNVNERWKIKDPLYIIIHYEYKKMSSGSYA